MKKNKIVILLEGHEKIADEGIELLKKRNLDVIFTENINDLLSNKNAKLSDAILVRGSVVNRTLIENMPNLKIIARAGVGTDNIDIDTATKNKVFVCNVPDANFTSVAEHVIGMIISLSHQILNGDRALKKGDFDARHRYVGSELAGKKIGIVGYGKIGQLVASKCKYGLNMEVLAFDPYVKDTEFKDVRLVKKVDEIFEEADFISLHLPYIPSLHHFINGTTFKKMKPSAYIINCARGGLIDEIALAKAIQAKQIAGAGLDVFENEPPETDHILWNTDNVITTPHMAASTNESLAKMSIGAVKEIELVISGKKPINSLNEF